MGMQAATTLASAAIIGYQRYLSPHKGFRCAYGALHGGFGCSEAVRRLILAHGLVAAWPQVRERFAQCRAAMAVLRERAREIAQERAQQRARRMAQDSSTGGRPDRNPAGDAVVVGGLATGIGMAAQGGKEKDKKKGDGDCDPTDLCDLGDCVTDLPCDLPCDCSF